MTIHRHKSRTAAISLPGRPALSGAWFMRAAKALTLFCVLGVWSADPSIAVAINNYCPVLTDQAVDPAITVIYEGREVAFCCNKCRREFLADPERFVSALSLVTGDTGGGSHEGHDHEHDDKLAPVAGATSDSVHTGTGEQIEPETDVGHNHDHATDHADGPSRLVAFLGKFHPVIVHFPIALIIAAFVMSLVGTAKSSDIFDAVSIKMTYAAGAVTAATMLLGLAAGSGAKYPGELADYFSDHRILGITTAVMALVTAGAAYFYERHPTRMNHWLFRGLLLVSSLLVGVTAHLGATLIYGPHHFAF